ncbi:hypothetical protein K456DRAFT_1760306, partial [Colletotrichum gloeosporioides 23]
PTLIKPTIFHDCLSASTNPWHNQRPVRSKLKVVPRLPVPTHFALAPPPAQLHDYSVHQSGNQLSTYFFLYISPDNLQDDRRSLQPYANHLLTQIIFNFSGHYSSSFILIPPLDLFASDCTNTFRISPRLHRFRNSNTFHLRNHRLHATLRRRTRRTDRATQYLIGSQRHFNSYLHAESSSSCHSALLEGAKPLASPTAFSITQPDCASCH